MKKAIVLFLVCIVLYITLTNNKDTVIIPDKSIRFRIIANSNTKQDQELKLRIKDDINKKLLKLLNESNSIEQSRTIIKKNMKEINNIVSSSLQNNKSYQKYDVNFGKNYFPEKTYRGLKYKEGVYESLVVTLGEGKGENWWCVLFPPLCLVDAEDNRTDNVEYRFLVKQIIDKFSKK